MRLWIYLVLLVLMSLGNKYYTDEAIDFASDIFYILNDVKDNLNVILRLI